MSLWRQCFALKSERVCSSKNECRSAFSMCAKPHRRYLTGQPPTRWPHFAYGVHRKASIGRTMLVISWNPYCQSLQMPCPRFFLNPFAPGCKTLKDQEAPEGVWWKPAPRPAFSCALSLVLSLWLQVLVLLLTASSPVDSHWHALFIPLAKKTAW